MSYLDDSFIYCEEDDLYIHRSNREVDYHDNSEDYMIHLFGELGLFDNPGARLSDYIKDWPSRYHLSPVRRNLFEVVRELFNSQWEVLEIGAGMGSLTPWLADHVLRVDAVEGSRKRARALRLRVRDRRNVRVFVGDAAEMEMPGRYDLVTLIGVLEYIPFYFPEEDPQAVCRGFLARLRRCLKKDGILLIAIENKLGAKYFTGCSEDHKGKLFYGLSDYPGRSPVTFSRAELREIVKGAGLTRWQFYSLFPDFKFPQIALKDDPSLYEIKISGLMRGRFEDYSGKREHLFNEVLFLESLWKAELIHEFANSFLLLATCSDSIQLQSPWAIKKISNSDSIKPAFYHETLFLKQDSEMVVRRLPLTEGATRHSVGAVDFEMTEEESFVAGTSLIIKAHKAIQRADCQAVLARLLEKVLDGMLKEFSENETDEEGYPLVSGEAIDYCFWNLVEAEDATLIFIDRKWRHIGALPSDFALFRSLLYLFRDAHPFIQESQLSDFVIPVLNRVFSQYNLRRFQKNLSAEVEFQASVRRNPITVDDLQRVPAQKCFELTRAFSSNSQGSSVKKMSRRFRNSLFPSETMRGRLARRLWRLARFEKTKSGARKP